MSDLFRTTDEALAACEAAGLEPLKGPDYPDGNRYSVIIPGCRRYNTYYGDKQFLAWANAYFPAVRPASKAPLSARPTS